MGTIVPSTSGPFTNGPLALGVPCSCRTRADDNALRQAAAEEPEPGQPAAAANALPLLNAVAADVNQRLAMGLLCVIALWNRPAAPGDIRFAVVSMAPADWPPSVTLPGSPPNAAMLRWTQRS